MRHKNRDIFQFGVKRKPQPNPTNWQFAKHPKCLATSEKTIPTSANIKNKFPAVYTQPCGNCTSNAVLACDAYYYHAPYSDWMPSTIFTYYIQRVIEGDFSKEDTGSTIEIALDAVRKYGACNSTVWPNTKPFYKKPSKKAYEDGLKGHEVTTYYNVKSLLQIKKAISSGYPVVISVNWAFSSIDENYILNNPSKSEIKESENGHAVVIVGYDDDKQLFEIRNSWGPKWGNDGYGFITYTALKKVIWYDDSYAIVK